LSCCRSIGDAIIVTDPIDVSLGQLQAKRNDRKDVARFIVSDLAKAIDLLPNYADIPTSEDGHVSKEAAEAFLSAWHSTKVPGRSSTTATPHSPTRCSTSAKAAKTVMDGGQFYLYRHTGRPERAR
jgi:hypothetical protein